MTKKKAGLLWKNLGIRDERGLALQKIGDKLLKEFLTIKKPLKTAQAILKLEKELTDLTSLEKIAVCFVVVRVCTKSWTLKSLGIPNEILDS